MKLFGNSGIVSLIALASILILNGAACGQETAEATQDKKLPFDYVADRMTAGITGGERFLKMEGNVVISRNFVKKAGETGSATGTYVLKGDSLDYAISTKIAFVKGNVYVTDGESTITSDEAEYDDANGKAIFTGFVKLVMGAGTTMEAPCKSGKLLVSFDDVGQITEAKTSGDCPVKGQYVPEKSGDAFFGQTGTAKKPKSTLLPPK